MFVRVAWLLALVWRVYAVTEWSTQLCAAATSCALLAVSPVGQDGRVIVLLVDTIDDQIIRQNATLLSIDARTGSLVWRWRNFDNFYRPSLRASPQLRRVPGSALVLFSYLMIDATMPDDDPQHNLFVFVDDSMVAPTTALWQLSLPWAMVAPQLSSDALVCMSEETVVFRINVRTGVTEWEAVLKDVLPFSALEGLSLAAPVRATASVVSNASWFDATAAASGDAAFTFDYVYALVNHSARGSLSPFAGAALIKLDAHTGRQLAAVDLSRPPLGIVFQCGACVQLESAPAGASLRAGTQFVVLAYGTACAGDEGPCAGTSLVAFELGKSGGSGKSDGGGGGSDGTAATLVWRRDLATRAWHAAQAFEFDWRARLAIGVLVDAANAPPAQATQQLAAISLHDGLVSWRLAVPPTAVPTASVATGADAVWPRTLEAGALLQLGSLSAARSAPHLQQSLLLVDVNATALQHAATVPPPVWLAPPAPVSPTAAASALVCTHSGRLVAALAPASMPATAAALSVSFAALGAQSLVRLSNATWWLALGVQRNVLGGGSSGGNATIAELLLIGRAARISNASSGDATLDAISQCFLPSTWGIGDDPEEAPSSSWWYDVANWSLVRRGALGALVACGGFAAAMAVLLQRRASDERDAADESAEQDGEDDEYGESAGVSAAVDGVELGTVRLHSIQDPDDDDDDSDENDASAVDIDGDGVFVFRPRHDDVASAAAASAPDERLMGVVRAAATSGDDDESDVIELMPPRLRLYEDDDDDEVTKTSV